MTTCTSFSANRRLDCRDWRTARTKDLGHGRLAIRDVVASTELNDFLAGQWAGLAQVFRLTRTEVVYGITSLSPARASAARLLLGSLLTFK